MANGLLVIVTDSSTSTDDCNHVVIRLPYHVGVMQCVQ